MEPLRLVCTGDSFTEGMCDEERSDGNYRGWADRLALHLAATSHADVGYANLAIRGKLLDQVAAEQLPAAEPMAPTILTFHAGPNDVLRRGVDIDDLVSRYDRAVATARTLAETTLLFTSIGRAGGDSSLAIELAHRFARFNRGVRDAAVRHGALLVDLERVPALADRRMWHTDRLHLNAEGHRRVSAAAAAVLAGHAADDSGAWWATPLPVAPRRSRIDDLRDDALWVRRDLLPWVGRRLRGVSSGDGRSAKVPTLTTVGAEGAPR